MSSLRFLPAGIVRRVQFVHQRAQLVDHGAGIHPRFDHFGGEIAQAVVQLATFVDVSEQELPVFGAVTGAGVATIVLAVLLRSLGRLVVPKVADQKLHDLVDQLTCFCLADIGQIVPANCSRFSAMPTIEAPGLGVDAEARQLLAVAEKLDLLYGPTRRRDADLELFERFVCSERECAFRRLTDACEGAATVRVVPAHMVFDCARGFLVQNIEIEHRHMPGQNASVIGVGPCQRPHFDLFAGDLLQVLPAVQPLAFIVLAIDRRGLAVERNR